MPTVHNREHKDGYSYMVLKGICLRKPARELARALPCAALIAIAALTTIPNRSAIAAEGGGGFYLLGQRGQGAAALPPVEGVFFAMPTYFYSGDVSGSQPLEVGGAATLGLDADVQVVMPTAMWMTPVDFLVGDLGFSATFVYGSADLTANIAVSIPGIGDSGFSDSDDRWATSASPRRYWSTRRIPRATKASRLRESTA